MNRLGRFAAWLTGRQTPGEAIDYIVSFSIAERKIYGVRVTITNDSTTVEHIVSATSLPDLESQVRTLAHAFGRDCFPYVRPRDPAQLVPHAFFIWADSLKMQFIAYVPISEK